MVTIPSPLYQPLSPCHQPPEPWSPYMGVTSSPFWPFSARSFRRFGSGTTYTFHVVLKEKGFVFHKTVNGVEDAQMWIGRNRLP